MPIAAAEFQILLAFSESRFPSLLTVLTKFSYVNAFHQHNAHPAWPMSSGKYHILELEAVETKSHLHGDHPHALFFDSFRRLLISCYRLAACSVVYR